MIEMTTRIAKGVKCRLHWDGQRVGCEWTPDKPRHTSRKMRKRYYAARHEFLEAVAKDTGGTIAVMDL